MGDDVLKVFFVSNGTAITAETLGSSLLAQFPQYRFSSRTIPFVDSLQKVEKVIEEIESSVGAAEQLPLVICTMDTDELTEAIHRANAIIIDPFSVFVPELENKLHAEHLQPAESHRTRDRMLYDSRINAIEFSLIHDDGSKISNYHQADVIIIGVSRSGKTPASLYLALQFGIKAANYPITEEDMENPQLPEPIRDYRDKLYGLTTDPNLLASIRQTRRPDSRYASMAQCRQELKAVEEMFLRHRIQNINTASMSVEEIAARIIKDTGMSRR